MKWLAGGDDQYPGELVSCDWLGWGTSCSVSVPPLHGSLLRAVKLYVAVVDLVLGEQAVLGVWRGKFPVDWGQ